MNRMFTKLPLIALACCIVLYAKAAVIDLPLVSDRFIPIFIHKIQNLTPAECAVDSAHVPAGQSVKLQKPIEIPFCSIKGYLKEFREKKPYTPRNACKIETEFGLLYVWWSEHGIMCAPDPEESKTSVRMWKAKNLKTNDKKVVSNEKVEHPGKKIILATLILKSRPDKLKVSLEPAR